MINLNSDIESGRRNAVWRRSLRYVGYRARWRISDYVKFQIRFSVRKQVAQAIEEELGSLAGRYR